MTEIESLFKLFGMPGAFLGLGVMALKTLAPMWRDHLKETGESLRIVATSMQEMVRWQRTIDLRLDRIERTSDENTDNVRILYERAGEKLPTRLRITPRKQATHEE